MPDTTIPTVTAMHPLAGVDCLSGIECQHCAAALRAEVSNIPGVIHVTQDCDRACLVVTSRAPLEHKVLAAAVYDAGYGRARPGSPTGEIDGPT